MRALLERAESPHSPLGLGLLSLRVAEAASHVCEVTVSGKGCRELEFLVCDSSLWHSMPCKTRPLECYALVTHFVVPWWPLCILSSLSFCLLSGITSLLTFIAVCPFVTSRFWWIWQYGCYWTRPVFLQTSSVSGLESHVQVGASASFSIWAYLCSLSAWH